MLRPTGQSPITARYAVPLKGLFCEDDSQISLSNIRPSTSPRLALASLACRRSFRRGNHTCGFDIRIIPDLNFPGVVTSLRITLGRFSLAVSLILRITVKDILAQEQTCPAAYDSISKAEAPVKRWIRPFSAAVHTTEFQLTKLPRRITKPNLSLGGIMRINRWSHSIASSL